ncbi:uncharacterized protein LOC130136702 [Syzygium oleosum]|uniref:uncharacterized protein LOC130136702 n=1 Tax=Syzygium oleosum TaxID=219896 RepID=UPI0024BBC0A0|nr:uncharacterized protein LOC130136702 [Syzygium oleosum]
MTSLETSLAQFGHQPAPATPEPSGAEHKSEPEESQAEYDPMDVDLEVIPEEEEEPEAKPEEAPEDEHEDEPEEEPVHVPPYEQWIDAEFVPEYESDEEPVEEERDEVPAESGDIDHPIEIKAEPES